MEDIQPIPHRPQGQLQPEPEVGAAGRKPCEPDAVAGLGPGRVDVVCKQIDVPGEFLEAFDETEDPGLVAGLLTPRHVAVQAHPEGVVRHGILGARWSNVARASAADGDGAARGSSG